MSILSHVEILMEALEGQDVKIDTLAERIAIIKKNRKRLWALGNGGSMAIAQHFAQDLLKTCGVRAQSLNCPSIITAYANDEDFRNAFVSPLWELFDEGDGIIIFSCSGSSRNYDGIEKITKGRGDLLSVVGTDGGFLKRKADYSVHVNSKDYQVCETAFSVICDLIILGVRQK